jgi:hypothetical protein
MLNDGQEISTNYTSEIKMLLFYNIFYLELISIISENDAAVWSKTNFGPAAHLTLEVVPFRRYAQFPALLTFFKCILEVMFCECVRH